MPEIIMLRATRSTSYTVKVQGARSSTMHYHVLTVTARQCHTTGAHQMLFVGNVVDGNSRRILPCIPELLPLQWWLIVAR